MSRRRTAVLALLLLFSASCSGGPPQPAARTIEIGVDLPLSGPQAPDSQAALIQLSLVLDGIYHGRVEGLPVTLRVLSESSGDARDPLQGRRNVLRLAAEPAVLAVVGPLDSDVAEAEIPVATAAHLALVSPSASNACLTRPLADCDGLSARLRGAGPTSFFRVVPGDDGEAAAAVEFATGRLRATRFAVGSDGQAYGTTLRDRFTAALKQRRLTPVYSGDVDPANDVSVDAFLAAAKAAGADAVMFGGRGDGGTCRLAAKIPAALGSDVPLLGGAGLVGAACEKDAGAGSSSVYAAQESQGTEARDAVRSILRAIAAAIKSEGGNRPSREQVRLAISRGSSPAFDSRGDPRVRRYYIVRGPAPGPDLAPARWVEAGTVSL